MYTASAASRRQFSVPLPKMGWMVLAALFFLQATANEWLYRLQEIARPAVHSDQVQKNPELYRVLSFGHLPSAVDWLWIVSLTKTDVVKVADKQHSKFFHDVDTMTDLDPLFAEVYVASANLLAVVQNDGIGARIILEKGEEFRNNILPQMPDSYRQDYWPYPWQVPLLLAYVHLFELNDMPHGAVYFKEAASLPGSPPYLANLSRRLERPGGEYEVGLKLLNFMINKNPDDQKAREGLEKKRSDLFIGQYLHDLNLSFATFSSNRVGRSILSLWAEFRRESKISEVDPWGGKLSVDTSKGAGGKIVSTTPHAQVFGLE